MISAQSGKMFDDDGRSPRTGTIWSCIAHIITGVIGSGVLSLAWTTSQLGWVAGPASILCFACVTYISSCLLADCYRTPDPETGTRNYSYSEVVRVHLGDARKWICIVLQCVSMYVTGVVYVITTATSMREIYRNYHSPGNSNGSTREDKLYMILFGAVQVVMSQIPDFQNMVWLSVTASVMSFSYSFIGFGLSFAKVIENKRMMGSISGVPSSDKVFHVFTAIADNAFAYPYSLILIEIQDTLRSPPAENKTMKKASWIAICITTFFYINCSVFGYGAFGNKTPGNLLLGFKEPRWLVDFANACIIIHLVGGYQIYSQPVFGIVEGWFSKKFPGSKFVNKFHTLRFPLLPPFSVNVFKMCFRSAYVVSTTLMGIGFPYFNSVLALLGAVNFWPLAVYFPVEMYFVRTKVGGWSRRGIALRTFSLLCFLVSVVGLIGSLQGIIKEKLG